MCTSDGHCARRRSDLHIPNSYPAITKQFKRVPIENNIACHLTVPANFPPLFSEKKYEPALKNLNKAESFIDPDSTLPESKKTISSLNNFKGFCYLALNKIENHKANYPDKRVASGKERNNPTRAEQNNRQSK